VRDEGRRTHCSGKRRRSRKFGGSTEAAEQVGYPVMLKAAAGGGGRGIRVAADAAELEAQYAIATREAQSAFGYGGLYLERFVGMARHVEVQIIADGERAIHLFERECSLQRRRQKLVEEAPSPSLTEEVRRKCARRPLRWRRPSATGE